MIFKVQYSLAGPPELLATDPELRVRFPALPDFLRGSGSETGCTQLVTSYLEEIIVAPV
jgi:hypothetical protein